MIGLVGALAERTRIQRGIVTNGAHAAPFVRVPGRRLRHNRRMLLIRILTVCALLTVAGCDMSTPPTAPARGGATASTLTSGMEFSGERDCVDCDGIESWLRLEQLGKARRYRMVEVYYGQDHDRRFEDVGQWHAEGELLRLHSSQGGERVYARLDDGVLQARGAQGQRIPVIENDVLEPTGFDSTR